LATAYYQVSSQLEISQLFATLAANVEVIAAGGANVVIQVTKIYINRRNSATSFDITFLNGTSPIGRVIYNSARPEENNEPLILESMAMSCTANTAFNAKVNDIDGTVDLMVEYNKT
jgi:hypothetical protein